ncbi:MAG: hypothetical protein ABW032_00640 [Burkholderiaceae bacterium]
MAHESDEARSDVSRQGLAAAGLRRDQVTALRAKVTAGEAEVAAVLERPIEKAQQVFGFLKRRISDALPRI